MTIIDAHQHVWDLERVAYPWLNDDFGVLNRTYPFDEAASDLDACGITASILVQAANSTDETRWMQTVADAHSRVRGIVAWAPLDDPAETERLLTSYAEDPRIVGIRHLIHNEPDEEWLLRPEVTEGLAVLADRDMPFDVVAVANRHLELVPKLSERLPSLRMVIDHLAKPPIAEQGWQPWASLIGTVAENPAVYAKISGLNTAATPYTWTADDLRPYVEHAMEVFGAERLMYGGDWPITLMGGGYRKTWQATTAMLAELSEDQRESILWRSAAEFYRMHIGVDQSDSVE